MPAEPHGAADTGPTPPPSGRGPAIGCSGWFGRYGARCARTATGPTPGPPPPCGMQKVLCRFRCETSPPNVPGLARPTMRVQVRAVDVDLAARGVHQVADLGDLLLEHAVRRGVGDHQDAERVARACRSSPSGRRRRPRRPRGRRRPPRACRPSPRRRRWCRAPRTGSGTRRAAPAPGRGGRRGRPAGRPARPASRRWAAPRPARSRSPRPASPPAARSATGSPRPGPAGAKGWIAPNSGQVIGSISVVAFSFIVQEPSGIIERSSAMSRSASLRR